MHNKKMYKLIFYVPVDDAQGVKEAIFQTGAGHIGNYSHCSWETLGTGQFLALKGANPTLGDVGHLEKVEELKVEILCSQLNIGAAVKALKNAHPYEEPAFEILSIENYMFEVED